MHVQHADALRISCASQKHASQHQAAVLGCGNGAHEEVIKTGCLLLRCFCGMSLATHALV